MSGLDNAIQLQKEYENGELNISNMADSEYKLLEKVYTVQIYQLDSKIKLHQRKIEECKQDILKIRKNIE